MNGPTLQVQMLGQFTLRYGDRTISDSDDRSRRVWSLLAYMLYNHGRSFAQEELIHLLFTIGFIISWDEAIFFFIRRKWIENSIRSFRAAAQTDLVSSHNSRIKDRCVVAGKY